MKLFIKAVVTGFAWSLGAALFKKIQSRVGLGQPDQSPDAKQGGAGDPHLQQNGAADDAKPTLS
jgi:hypothetical protein